jgi:uncharacterized Zn finger protein
MQRENDHSLACPRCGSSDVVTRQKTPALMEGGMPYVVGECVPCGAVFSQPAMPAEIKAPPVPPTQENELN